MIEIIPTIGYGVFLMASGSPSSGPKPLFVESIMRVIIALVIIGILAFGLWWILKRGFSDYYKNVIGK